MKIIEMPTGLYSQHEFEPLRVDYSAPEAGGRIGGVQAGTPLWQATYTVDPTLLPGESDQVRAFNAQIRGATRRLYGRDISRPFPLAHSGGFGGMVRAGGGAFDGTATSWSQAITADSDQEITLEGLPTDFTLSVGDYVGFSYVATDSSVAGLTWHACVRVVEGGTTDVDGSVTVMVEPPIPAAVPAGAVAYLDQPACIMVLITDQSKLQPIGFRLAIQGAQFVCIQDIRSGL